ncbi:hypothetical protein GCM10020295_19820 [Streptomyces cinereospinus]
MHSVSGFRQWLLGRPQLVVRMMRHLEKAHSPVLLNYPGAPAPAARRRPPGARLWISRAPEEALHVLCLCGLSVGCSQLVELGQGDFLEDPDLDQLVRMLEMLPPELAQLVVYGLTFATHLPAHRFTESHGEELRRAVAVKGEPVAADVWERPSCTPAIWGEETEAGAAAGEDADSTARAQAPSVPAPDILSLRTTGLREGAAELAHRLEAFTAAIRDGRQPAGHEALLGAVTSWMRERQFLAEAFAEAVPAAADGAEPSDPWGPDLGWVEAAALTERLREKERERGADRRGDRRGDAGARRGGGVA